MGTKLLEPNITIDPIEIEMDEDSQYAADKLIAEFGRNIPIVKIGKYVLGFGELIEFHLTVKLNSIPTFDLTVNDDQYLIREQLKNDVDTCTIFVGYSNWYIKFNGKLNKTYSDTGDNIIELKGELYNEKLYESVQKSYKEKTIIDIIKDNCESTLMGLYIVDNPDLNKELEYCINPNKRYIDFIEETIRTHTTNVFAFDCFYFLHLVDIDLIKDQELDKYSLDWKTGESISEQPLIFKSKKREGDPEEEDYKIPINYYTIDTNFSELHTKTAKKYFISYDLDVVEELTSKEILGVGTENLNTFFGFKDSGISNYNALINKKIAGNLIKLFLRHAIFEITPFSIIEIELYLPFTNGRDISLDTEHSGKKIVIGYTLDYTKTSDKSEQNYITQTLEVI